MEYNTSLGYWGTESLTEVDLFLSKSLETKTGILKSFLVLLIGHFRFWIREALSSSIGVYLRLRQNMEIQLVKYLTEKSLFFERIKVFVNKFCPQFVIGHWFQVSITRFLIIYLASTAKRKCICMVYKVFYRRCIFFERIKVF